MYLVNRLSLKHKELVFILSKAYKTMADQNLLSGVNLLQLFSGIFFLKCHNICCCKIKIIALEHTNLKDYFVSGAIFFNHMIKYICLILPEVLCLQI